MRLDRNIEGNEGRGKYALLKLRELGNFTSQQAFGGLAPEIASALRVLENAGILDWGVEGSESEFFLIRLKDRYAHAALEAYANAASLVNDTEWAKEVRELAFRAGPFHPQCKKPD